MATVNFLYRSTKENAPLTIRLLFRNENKDIVIGGKTQFKIYSSEEIAENLKLSGRNYWLKLHNKKKFKATRDVDELNEQQKIKDKQTEVRIQLRKLENYILERFNNENVKNINKAWLENQIELYYNPPEEFKRLPKELLKYFDKFLEYKKTEISQSTIKKYKVVKNLLQKYEDNLNKTLYLIDVNASFKKDFEEYCLKNKYATNTIAWAIRTIKTVCNHAKYNGLETNIQLDRIKIKSSKVDNIYLSFEELNKIQKEKPEKLTESLQNARDWLIISCYTGQRISDFMRFTQKQIRIEKGKYLLEFTQVKTGKTMTIPLHKKVLEILNKRNGAFPRPISSQKYNTYIKKVCEIAEIIEEVKGSKRVESDIDGKFPYRNEVGMYKKWELVTSHIGRRSFATNFYGEIPTSFLIYVTGHSTEQMFLNYIGKSNKDLALEITNYF